MENVELMAMQLITAAGVAKSCYIEAIEAAKNGNFEETESLLKEGSTSALSGHEVHAQLIAMSARGELDSVPLLLIHAEDQMMNCETMQIFAQQTIALIKENKALKEKVGLL